MSFKLRTEMLLGKEKLKKIRNSTVLVCGLGGVGGIAVETLARMGVGRLIVVDFDVVNETNINRQIIALTTKKGLKKTDVTAERVNLINPECDIVKKELFITSETLDEVFDITPDVLIDAIDSVNSKVNLIESAMKRGIPVISSMGAGGRMDSSKITVGDISESYNCPLARIIRKRLHRRNIYTGILVVYSYEKAHNKGGVYTEPEGEEIHEHGRKRVPIGSIAYIPSIFGLKAAESALKLIIGTEE